MGKMRRAVLDRPLAHGGRNRVCQGQIQFFPLVHGAAQAAVHICRKPRAHDLVVKHHAAKQFRYIAHRVSLSLYSVSPPGTGTVQASHCPGGSHGAVSMRVSYSHSALSSSNSAVFRPFRRSGPASCRRQAPPLRRLQLRSSTGEQLCCGSRPRRTGLRWPSGSPRPMRHSLFYPAS